MECYPHFICYELLDNKLSSIPDFRGIWNIFEKELLLNIYFRVKYNLLYILHFFLHLTLLQTCSSDFYIVWNDKLHIRILVGFEWS